ncbi:PREDICTED: noelin-3-like [Branchiostoma belcheri]|uniref:Noelin-3-like n=1 Tax=Branchiostoma belcheri TaxID=7741 RepID=A0A6P4YXA1_BRABE|nr:PREDICTED: noelin-3-like [Branchiostoma belcheri]
MFVKAGFAAIFAAVAVTSSLLGTSLACQDPVTSFSGRRTIRGNGGDGTLLRDQHSSADNADKVWYLPTTTGNTIEEYRTMDDFVAGNVLTTYRLPGSGGSGGMAWWGQGHVVYNNALYYQRFPDCLSYNYDCTSNEKAQIVKYDFNLRAFVALQSLPTAQLSHWAAGPSYVYLAVDAGSVWAIGRNNGVYQLTKLNANDLSIEETIDTEFADPSANVNMPPFIACGKFYSTRYDRPGQFSPIGSRTILILDLTTKQKDTSTQAWYCLPLEGRRYFSINSRENKVYTVESNALVSYDVTLGGSYLTDPSMLCAA